MALFLGERSLQQALGVVADGVNGPKTQAAAQRADPTTLLIDILTRRALFYRDFTLADFSQSRFLRGWLKRLFLLQSALLTHS